MKKLLLILLLFVSGFVSAQELIGDTLILYKGADIGGQTDLNSNKIVNLADPTNPQDAVTLQYFNDNAFSTGMVLDSLMWATNISNLTVEKGKLYLDSVFQALAYSPDGINSIFIGRMLLNPLVINNTGSLIENLKVVYVDGAVTDRLSIQLADKSTFDESRLIGVTTEDITNGATGNVTRFGLIQGNTQGLYVGAAVGDLIYLGSNGNLTNIPASGGDFNVFIGVIKKIGITDGELYVNPNLQDYTAETISPRGWSDEVVSNTILFPTNATRTFQILGSGYVYEDGIKYEFNNPSVVWADVEGTIDFYFDQGVLTAANNLPESQVREIYSTKPGAARMYWDATNDTIIYVNDMRHTFDMNGNTWATFWDTNGCIVLDGLGIVDIQTEGTGNVAADAQFGNGSGVIRNQDIVTNIPAVTSTTGYTVFYREGTDAWRSADGAPFPVITTGTGRLAWNEDVAGTWQLTEVVNGDFVLCHLFTSNTLGDKMGTVVGQNDYATLAAARTGAQREIQELLFSQFPIRELAPVATVIYETRTNYSNAVQARTRQSTDPVTGELVDFIDWRDPQAIAGSTGGTGASTFDDLTDTPATKTGSANKAVTVNGTEDALIYSDVVLTVNGDAPTAGNYDIVLSNNKVGENIEIIPGGTGTSTTFSVADNDNSTTNELQDLGNSKLNNDVTVTISNGTNTTITNLARTDFANTFSEQQNAPIFKAGNGSAANPSVEVGSNSTGIYLGNFARLGISSNGIEVATIGDISNFNGRVDALNFRSIVATGTQPYETNSTTLNTNLNADLLDSQEGSYYLDLANSTGTLSDSNLSSNVAFKNLTNTFVAQTTFDIGALDPIIIARNGTSNTNVNIRFDGGNSIGGTNRYLGMDGNAQLKWGPNADSNSNFFVYHSGNANLSSVDWNAQYYSVAGQTVIDNSRNYTGGSGSFGGQTSVEGSEFLVTEQNTTSNTAKISMDFSGGFARIRSSINGTATILPLGFYSGSTLIQEVNSSGIDVTGSGTFSGDVSALNFLGESSTVSSRGARIALGRNTGSSTNFVGMQVRHGVDNDQQSLEFYTKTSTFFTDPSILAMKLGGDSGTQNVELNYNGSKKLATTSGGIDVTGTVTADNVFKKTTQTLSGTTPTYNCSTSVNAKITLTGNTTATLTNLVDGMSGNFYVTQDGTGGHTLTLSPTPKVINGGAGVVALTGTAGSTDIISWAYDGTTLYVTYGLNYN